MPGAVHELPYSPVPVETEKLQPTPDIHVNAPIEAFGSPQAHALGQLGQATSKIGDEIYTRAQAMQQIKNQADARQAYVDMSQEGQQLYENFASKGGADAGPDQLKAFQQGMNDLRDKYRKTMTNVDAAHEFDAYSTSELVRLGNLAAGHAARQLKVYNDSAVTGLAEHATSIAMNNPTDPAARKEAFDKSDQAIDEKFHGLAPEELDNKKAEARSTIAAEQLKSIARSNPTLALAKYDEDTKSGVLRGTDSSTVKAFIDRENQRITSRNVAHGINDGSSQVLGQGVVSMDQAKAAIGPGLETRGLSGAAAYGATNPTSTASGKYQVLAGTFAQYKAQAGLGGMTFDQFKASSEAQEKFFESVFGGFMQKYGSFNAAASAWHLGEGAMKQKPDGTWGVDPDFKGAGAADNAAYLAKANAALADATPANQKEQAARREARALDPTNPDLEDMAASHTITQDRQQREARDHEKAQIKVTVDNEIMRQIEAGKAVSLDTLKEASPEVAAAVEKSDQLTIQRSIHAAMQQDDRWTDARETNANRLLGLAYSGDPTFKEVDLWKMDLSATQRKDLQALKGQAMAGKEIRDPEFIAAQHNPEIKGKLDGYDTGTKQEFWGALSTVLKSARAAGKPVTAEHINELADQLLERQGNSFLYRHFGIGGEETFRTLHNVPDDWRGDFTKKYTDKFGRTPSEETIGHSYASYLFNVTKGGKTDAD